MAGKFPKLDACFNPVSELARARAYFRATAAGSDWYYVEMKAGVPCYSGVLPKPKKALVGQTIEYYLDVSNRSLAEARTEEIKAYVVEKASDCKAKLPVAPLLNAAHVVVYPAAGSAAAVAVVPAGFASAAGLGAAATAAVVGGGVAVATGGAVAATQTGSSPTTTLAPPVVTQPPATLPPATNPPGTTTTTTMTLPSADVPFSPVFKVYKGGVAVDAVAVTGDDPLPLTFDMCQSSGPYKMTFDVVVNGRKVAAGCLSTVTFTTLGAKVNGLATVRRSAGDASYEVSMNIRRWVRGTSRRRRRA